MALRSCSQASPGHARASVGVSGRAAILGGDGGALISRPGLRTPARAEQVAAV